MNLVRIMTTTAVVFLLMAPAAIAADENRNPTPGRSAKFDYIVDPGLITPDNFICGTRPPQDYLDAFNDAVARGEIPDPALQSESSTNPPVLGTLYRDTISGLDLWLYPDVNSLLISNFSDGALFNLMTAASNELISQHGDQYDVTAFWLSYSADHQIGAAFYLGLENDNGGIGQGFYNSRPSFGLAGVNTEGYVMMWNVNDWQPGTNSFAAFTRLVLGQEFEHRWGMFLNDILADGDLLQLQGDDGPCGRGAHWNFNTDGQGSGMEVAEWTGAGPTSRLSGTVRFNTDIGGVFSYLDLYLMGYVSPQELDDSSSEIRYMLANAACGTPYSGPISSFSSSNIVVTNGVRTPPSTLSQKHFKAGWVMFYLPSSFPTQTEIDRAINIMKQHEIDWAFGVEERGTIDNSIDEGHFTSGGTLIGPGPQTVQFDADTDSLFGTTAWKWYFGDGDSSSAADPSHTYDPGPYSVELKITTPHDVRQTLKKNHVILWADTIWMEDIEIPYDTGAFYWDVWATNKVPINDFTLPVILTNVPSTLALDSMSFIGCRTSYFEYKQLVFDNRGVGQVAYRMRADNGGGSAYLGAGSGLIARIWMHTTGNTGPNETVEVSVGPLGSQTYKTITLNSISFVPPFNAATLTVRDLPCQCACHADPACDAAIDVVDVVVVVNEAFRGGTTIVDSDCTHISRNDVDCDCAVSITDVVRVIDVAFRGGDPALKFCNACTQPCP
jgi:hypothetical protein